MVSMRSTLSEWFKVKGWEPQDFQLRSWETFEAGGQGIVNAPTGSGKTYSLLLPALYRAHCSDAKGLKVIWICPIRALAREIEQSCQLAIDSLFPSLRVGIRTGDTGVGERRKQWQNMPDVLITTPESLHLLLASKGNLCVLQNVQTLVADEWHELMGSKRGVQVALAISRIRSLNASLQVWGISATIGNIEEAGKVLLGSAAGDAVLIRSGIKKELEVITLFPDTLERFPWSGHLGIHLLPKVLPVILESGTCLLFTNTRAQAEIWYKALIDAVPDLAGLIAMHHGSISKELRTWVEDSLHEGKLKVVVCTSSLDLGVDFRPVDTIIQVGGAKGVSRFAQRAGRSGHLPGAVSRIYFVPTHSLEILEGSALREALANDMHEERQPYVNSMDVLVQYMATLAVGEGFRPEQLYREVCTTYAYQYLSYEAFSTALTFLVGGGASLASYPEFKKLTLKDGMYRMEGRRSAMQHRLSIGTITSDAVLNVKQKGGQWLGTIEEYFISRLSPGDSFWFAGRNLEFVRIRDMVVEVIPSKAKEGQIPSWQGGRMPLSSTLGQAIRNQLKETGNSEESIFLKPLFLLQEERSILPAEGKFLIEKFRSREGCHCFFYPFEGRNVHEGLAALFAYRIGQVHRVTFSIAMNDYGFELLSASDIPLDVALERGLLSEKNLMQDLALCVNDTEMARRRFRDISRIAGLVFSGYPGKQKRDRNLQASAGLFFNVFMDEEPEHFLLKQAYEEVYDFQLELHRMQRALKRISEQEVILLTPEKATPFAFPIMAERLREKYSNESLSEQIARLQKTIT
jgi:ATP-dependent helicase Lhr and Lhr-like helicase